MEKREEEQILGLVGQVPELRGLYEEHIELKRQLERLNHRIHLSTSEEIEKKRLQKLKLAGKDRMMEIVHQYTPMATARSMQAST